jgi:hypothetical protein
MSICSRRRMYRKKGNVRRMLGSVFWRISGMCGR